MSDLFHDDVLSIEPLLEAIPSLDLRNIDWVIAGGESGPRAREVKAEWISDLRDQCRSAGVAFFFKQWGGRNKKKTGRTLDGRTWDEMPACDAICGSSPRRLIFEDGSTADV